MSRLYFGTDGVRGPYGGPVVNEEFAARLAAAAAQWARVHQAKASAASAARDGGVASFHVPIGRDTRGSGAALEAAVARGLRAAGAVPVSLGVLPTPAVARAVHTSGAALGVVITASHNPASDNGIKFFGPGGIKLTDHDETQIEGFLGAAIATPAVALEGEATAVAAYLAVAQAMLPAD